jgi:hypothetical protein
VTNDTCTDQRCTLGNGFKRDLPGISASMELLGHAFRALCRAICQNGSRSRYTCSPSLASARGRSRRSLHLAKHALTAGTAIATAGLRIAVRSGRVRHMWGFGASAQAACAIDAVRFAHHILRQAGDGLRRCLVGFDACAGSRSRLRRYESRAGCRCRCRSAGSATARGVRLRRRLDTFVACADSWSRLRRLRKAVRRCRRRSAGSATANWRLRRNQPVGSFVSMYRGRGCATPATARRAGFTPPLLVAG